MKLSQLLHKIPENQLIIIREYTTEPPSKILVKGTKKNVKKDNALNGYTVREIWYNQAYMIVGISNKECLKGGATHEKV